MNKIAKIFWIIYLILIFLPIAVLLTVITAILTIIFSFIGDYRWCYMPAKYWSRAICRLSFVKVTIEGRENYSKNKSYIFIPNHQSMYDVFVLYGWLINKFKWVMKEPLRKIPFVGVACEKAGHIFIDQNHPMKAQHSIEQAKKMLENNSSIVIFAEGSRTRDGNMGRFKKGAFKIAKDLSLPIVPITIKGAFQVLPRGKYYIKPHPIKVFFHEPIKREDVDKEDINTLIEHTRAIIASKL